MALFTSRVIAETGVDGVRLDGLGGQFAPCENPSHHHESIFENQGTAANVQMARCLAGSLSGCLSLSLSLSLSLCVCARARARVCLPLTVRAARLTREAMDGVPTQYHNDLNSEREFPS